MDQLYPPWGEIGPHFWQAVSSEPPLPSAAIPERPTDHAPPPPPEHYRERVTALTAGLASNDADRLTQAALEAERLDEEITAEYGPTHTHTLQIRELRGHLAHLAGDHANATRWYLHTTAAYATTYGTGHPATQASSRRAAHLWLQVTDPAAATALSRQLLPLLASTVGDGSELHRHLTARQASLTSKPA
jgi:hypothetical protein